MQELSSNLARIEIEVRFKVAGNDVEFGVKLETGIEIEICGNLAELRSPVVQLVAQLLAVNELFCLVQLLAGFRNSSIFFIPISSVGFSKFLSG